MNSTRGSASNLGLAMKELAIEWQQAKADWRDVKSIEFEQKFLETLPNDVARAVAVMEEIDGILRKVHTDCE